MTKLCGAKTRAGGKCKQPALPNGRCHYHGGKSLSGIASPQFIHGRHSKYLPTRLAADYQQAVNDPALLELRQELALLDTRLGDLLRRVDTGEAGSIWRAVGKAWSDLDAALVTGDKEKAHSARLELERLIKRGTADYAAWDEVGRVIEQRRKVAESERKRIEAAQQYVTSQQAMTLMAAVLGVIKENVNDRNTLQAISSGINALIAKNAG